MKMIVAVIRPEKLEAVQEALNAHDVYLMTVSDVRGCGRQRGYTEVYRGTEFQVKLLPKVKVEIAVNEAFVEATVEAIVHAARMGETGQIGDGKIFVLLLEDCIRIRTGERGSPAIGPCPHPRPLSRKVSDEAPPTQPAARAGRARPPRHAGHRSRRRGGRL